MASLLCSLLAATGCKSPLSGVTCTSSDSCLMDGVQGTCEATSYCSFPDATCAATGRRYGSESGDLSDQCVGSSGGDGGGDASTSRIDAGDARCAGLAEGAPCDTGAACIGGLCTTCAQIPACGLPDSCPTRSLAEESEIFFGDSKVLIGLGDAPPDGACGATQEDLDCGFTVNGANYLAICSRKACGSYNNSRPRPHVLTSDDAINWKYENSMTANPSGYWNGSSFLNAWQTYFVHNLDYPIALNDGSYLTVSRSSFQWINSEWVSFVPRWTSSDGLSWDGYVGETGSEQDVITWGFGTNVGAGTPSIYQTPEGLLIAYTHQAPHSNVTGVNKFLFKRFTSLDGTTWLGDQGFDYNTDATVYPDIVGTGRIYILGTSTYVFDYRADGSGACADATSAWRWATSATGLNDSFDLAADTRPWTVGCAAPVPTCAVSAHFFMRDGNRVRLFYRDGQDQRWYTALSMFVLTDNY